MDAIYVIHYIDAYYLLEETELGKTELSLHEAYGYVREEQGNIIITFLKNELLNETEDIDSNIVEGLIIPRGALVSERNSYNNELFEGMNIGTNVAVTWLDINHVANRPLRDCSVMYSEGIFFRDAGDHIVLKEPETIRIQPQPVANHPAIKPTYYMIPKTFITEVLPLR